MADNTRLFIVLLAVLSAEAFYLPGLRPTNFCKQDVKDRDPKADCKVLKFLLAINCERFGGGF